MTEKAECPRNNSPNPPPCPHPSNSCSRSPHTWHSVSAHRTQMAQGSCHGGMDASMSTHFWADQNEWGGAKGVKRVVGEWGNRKAESRKLGSLSWQEDQSGRSLGSKRDTGKRWNQEQKQKPDRGSLASLSKMPLFSYVWKLVLKTHSD